MVKLTNENGRVHWVNPAHVTHIEPIKYSSGNKATHLWVVSHSGYGTTRIVFKGDVADELAEKINGHSATSGHVMYVTYIQNNLERIERGGWTPICYEEFLSSEELIDLKKRVAQEH